MQLGVGADHLEELDRRLLPRGQLDPLLARGLDGVDRVDDHAAAAREHRLGDGLGDQVGGEPGRLVGVDARAEDRRLDRVDRHHRRPEAVADDLGDRALARAGQPRRDDRASLFDASGRHSSAAPATIVTTSFCIERKPSSRADRGSRRRRAS